MNLLLESLKALLFGIVEGVTEWLPISSTGHMILLDEFIQLQMTDAFKSMFEVVIQLGAILAVVVLYFSKLWPFKKPKKGEGFVGLFKMVIHSLLFSIVVLYRNTIHHSLSAVNENTFEKLFLRIFFICFIYHWQVHLRMHAI